MLFNIKKKFAYIETAIIIYFGYNTETVLWYIFYIPIMWYLEKENECFSERRTMLSNNKKEIRRTYV